MALETMKDVKEINGEKIKDVTGVDASDLSEEFIVVDHSTHYVGFKIQNGPIKEVGKNGCQVEDIIAVAKHIVEQLNAKFPCRENAMMITKLDEAIMWSKQRTINRKLRSVEGQSKL